MAENSKIQWTHHTFNPWRGCTKVSEGCKHCYAETMSKRNLKVLGQWGPNGTRVVASESMWREPMKWDAAAKAAGERHRVFCASLADVFEGRDTMPESSWEAVEAARVRLWDVIYKTKNLDWLLLTKRPENIAGIIGGESGAGLAFMEENMRNVWIGTSVENQQAVEERIPPLLKIPAAVRFLSMEPLLGPVEFSYVGKRADCLSQLGRRALGGIHWVIVGGESGHGVRPCRVEWIRSVRNQCEAAGVACFIKQLGARAEVTIRCPTDEYEDTELKLADPKGGDWDEWPAELRVREFPCVEATR